MIPGVEGTRPWGAVEEKGPQVSKGPKPPIQLLQLLKNSPREVKRANFRYIFGPPVSTQGMELMGPGRGRSLPVHPGFSSHVHSYVLTIADTPLQMWLLRVISQKR